MNSDKAANIALMAGTPDRQGPRQRRHQLLASSVTGGGITVNRFQQLFLLAMGQGKKQPAEWAAFVWQVLAVQGQKILKEGKTLETAEENLAELTAQAVVFAEKQVPVLRVLQVG